jgi:hypothetical protein
MRPPAVVVGAVLGEDGPQVPFAEDQDAVGEFGSGGSDEAFGEAVRSRASGWDLDGVDAGVGEDGVEGGGELAGPRRPVPLRLVPHDLAPWSIAYQWFRVWARDGTSGSPTGATPALSRGAGLPVDQVQRR